MSNYKDRSRRLARESYWDDKDRDAYECPDCGRSQDEICGGFEVHHKNGEPLDNRPENRVGLCRLCHNLREDKKPSKRQIRNLRGQARKKPTDDTENTSSPPTVYLAGAMNEPYTGAESWRSSLRNQCVDPGTVDMGSTPVEFNSPTEVELPHGCGRVRGVTAKDMRLIDQSDAIIAYFSKKEQVGTLTELVYAVTSGKAALVVFDESFVEGDAKRWISKGVEYSTESPVYWFLINFLEGDGWDGLNAEIEMRLLQSYGSFRKIFQDWEWHQRVASKSRTD